MDTCERAGGPGASAEAGDADALDVGRREAGDGGEFPHVERGGAVVARVSQRVSRDSFVAHDFNVVTRKSRSDDD